MTTFSLKSFQPFHLAAIPAQLRSCSILIRDALLCSCVHRPISCRGVEVLLVTTDLPGGPLPVYYTVYNDGPGHLDENVKETNHKVKMVSTRDTEQTITLLCFAINLSRTTTMRVQQ